MTTSPDAPSPDDRLTSAELLRATMFWASLFTAVVIYSATALAPRLTVWLELRQRYVERERHLIEMEAEIAHLERVAEALRNDPNFAAELARHEFDARLPNATSLPLDSELTFDPRVPAVAPRLETTPEPWFASPLRLLARNWTLQRAAYGIAAGVLIVAFVVLRPRQNDELTGRAAQSVFGRLAARYRVDPQPSPPAR